ncbi:MAG: transporter substrate-binding domain-containing protein [Candidatus Pelagadaptatus aseana]|uniref:substrate-binding periplasmic protein n=1 Tax=Candidatus Pelagadaptatus aseana TaxID=3120508 RepID=UPI0039B19C9D
MATYFQSKTKCNTSTTIAGLSKKLALLLLLFCSHSSAAELNAHFRSVPPDMFFKGNQPAGPIKEIAELALSRAGHSIHWQAVPWKRTQFMARAGNTDLLVRHSMTPEREQYLAPILIGYELRNVLFVKAPGKTIRVKHFKDLKQYRIGQRRGHFYARDFNDANNLNRELVNNHEQLVRMLQAGRIDLAVINDSEQGDLEALLAIDGSAIAEYKISYFNGRYCSIPLKSPAYAFFDDINREFFAMRASGEITEIMQRHGAEPFIQDFSTPESKAQQALAHSDT